MLLQGDFRGAGTRESEPLALMRDLGRANTAAWWPMVAIGCRALLGGGKPRRALEVVDAALADAHRESPNFEPPYMITGCRAAAGVVAGGVAAGGGLSCAA